MNDSSNLKLEGVGPEDELFDEFSSLLLNPRVARFSRSRDVQHLDVVLDNPSKHSSDVLFSSRVSDPPGFLLSEADVQRQLRTSRSLEACSPVNEHQGPIAQPNVGCRPRGVTGGGRLEEKKLLRDFTIFSSAPFGAISSMGSTKLECGFERTSVNTGLTPRDDGQGSHVDLLHQARANV